MVVDDKNRVNELVICFKVLVFVLSEIRLKR